VVGADAVLSRVRSWVTGGDLEPVYSHTSGFRGLVPAVRLPSLPDPGALQFWDGARRAPAALPDRWRTPDQLPGSHRGPGAVDRAGLDGGRRARRPPCGLHRLASGRHPDAHSCPPVAALGTVHPPPADPLEPRPGGAARRRCPCHAPAPGPGSQPGDRGRRRPGPPNWTAPPTSPPPCAATTTGGGSAPARFKPPLRPPLRRCTCPTGPPPGNAAPTSPAT